MLPETRDDRERLIRIEAKLDSQLYRTTQVEVRVDGHDNRIRGLETAHAKTIGIATGVSALMSLLVPYVNRLLN